MPGVHLSIRSGDAATGAAPIATPHVIAACSAGVVGSTYAFDPGADVSATLGGGLASETVYALLRQTGSRVLCSPATPTWSTAPSISHLDATGGASPTGPTVTVALASGAAGPFDDINVRITVSLGGILGSGQISVAYDGSTDVDVLPLPVETAGSLVGTGAITSATLGLVSALTLVLAAPSAASLTFPVGSLAAVAAGVHAATATVASPVTLLAAALLAGGIAALLANPRRLRFTTAGSTASDAPASVTINGTDYAGNTQSEVLVLAQTATSVVSVNAYKTIVSFVYPSADGTGATIAIGYEDAYASVAEFIAEVNTLAVAAPIAIAATDAQTSVGHYLALATSAVGGAATVTFNASPGTAATLLGFTTAETSTGAAATFSPPWTGLKFTFPSGTYVKSETYRAIPVGPTVSLAAELASMTTAHDNFPGSPFGFFVLPHISATGAACAARQSAVSSQLATWQADTTAPLSLFAVIAGTYHTPSTVLATTITNCTTADNALLAAFGGSSVAFDSVAHDDFYLPGASALRPGSFRRSTAIAWASQRASAAKVADDVSATILIEGSLLSPDGVTRARDETIATTKLGGGAGPGFSVLGRTSAGLGSPKFFPGATRAGNTSRLRYSGVVAVGKLIAATVFPVVEKWIGVSYPTDPSTGSLLDGEAQARAGEIRSALEPLLLTDQGGPFNVSALYVVVDNSGPFINTGLLPCTVTYVPLGETEQVNVAIVAQGIVILPA